MVFTIGLILAGALSTQDAARAADDLQVYSAVVAATIRPVITRRPGSVEGSEVVALLVSDRTVAACEEPRPRETPCLRPEQLRALSPAAPGEPIFGTLLTAAARTAVSNSFIQSNTQSRALPIWKAAGIVLIDPARLREESARLSTPGAPGFAAFSTPAYTNDGQAVVYASYFCGNVCGYGWFVLLKRDNGKWQVQTTHMLWIS
jgi:hypothetical protein